MDDEIMRSKPSTTATILERTTFQRERRSGPLERPFFKQPRSIAHIHFASLKVQYSDDRSARTAFLNAYLSSSSDEKNDILKNQTIDDLYIMLQSMKNHSKDQLLDVYKKKSEEKDVGDRIIKDAIEKIENEYRSRKHNVDKLRSSDLRPGLRKERANLNERKEFINLYLKMNEVDKNVVFGTDAYHYTQPKSDNILNFIVMLNNYSKNMNDLSNKNQTKNDLGPEIKSLCEKALAFNPLLTSYSYSILKNYEKNAFEIIFNHSDSAMQNKLLENQTFSDLKELKNTSIQNNTYFIKKYEKLSEIQKTVDELKNQAFEKLNADQKSDFVKLFESADQSQQADILQKQTIDGITDLTRYNNHYKLNLDINLLKTVLQEKQSVIFQDKKKNAAQEIQKIFSSASLTSEQTTQLMEQTMRFINDNKNIHDNLTINNYKMNRNNKVISIHFLNDDCYQLMIEEDRVTINQLNSKFSVLINKEQLTKMAAAQVINETSKMYNLNTTDEAHAARANFINALLLLPEKWQSVQIQERNITELGSMLRTVGNRILTLDVADPKRISLNNLQQKITAIIQQEKINDDKINQSQTHALPTAPRPR